MKSRSAFRLLIVTYVVWVTVVYLIVFSANHESDVFWEMDRDMASTLTPKPIRRTIVESFVISFDHERVEKFVERNAGIDGDSLHWSQAVDGYHQPTLNMWARLAGQEKNVINASNFDRNSQNDKDKHGSPHAVGCYLAHWNLLRSFHKRPRGLRPHAYMVFEDDASCVPDVMNRTLEAISYLPSDWDIFYIGGKPFTFFPKKASSPVLSGHNASYKAIVVQHDVCEGLHGTGDYPLAPDGSRQLAEEHRFWKTGYHLNTHSYVVNPERMDRVMDVVKPRVNAPIDIRLADAMKQGRLNGYMSTELWCETVHVEKGFNHTTPWNGYYHIPGLGYVKQRGIQHDNCPY